MNNSIFNPKTPNDIARELVGKIKQHRKKLKISQTQLANQVLVLVLLKGLSLSMKFLSILL